MPILKKGSKGDAVKILQYIIGVAVDGDFGSKTDKRVKEIQAYYSMPQTGLVDNNTWARLI